MEGAWCEKLPGYVCVIPSILGVGERVGDKGTGLMTLVIDVEEVLFISGVEIGAGEESAW